MMPVLHANEPQLICPCLFSYSPGTSSLRQAQAPLPSSLRPLLATLWQQVQCTPRLPGRCREILCPALHSSSRKPPSTAHGGNMKWQMKGPKFTSSQFHFAHITYSTPFFNAVVRRLPCDQPLKCLLALWLSLTPTRLCLHVSQT